MAASILSDPSHAFSTETLWFVSTHSQNRNDRATGDFTADMPRSCCREETSTFKENDKTRVIHRNCHPFTAFSLLDVSLFTLASVLLNSQTQHSSRLSCRFWFCSRSRWPFSEVVDPLSKQHCRDVTKGCGWSRRVEMTAWNPLSQRLQGRDDCPTQVSGKRTSFGHRSDEPT